MSLRACRTPPSYGWLRGWRTSTHSVRLLLAADRERRETWAFNCHTVSFGLRDSEDVLRHVTRTVFPNAAYVEWLLAHVLVETDGPANGEFVIYFNGVTVRHSGIWMGGRVQSKWGTGHLWEHALHEVPLRYGMRLASSARCRLNGASQLSSCSPAAALREHDEFGSS